MTDTFKVIYAIESSVRPIVCTFDDENKSIMFASRHPGSVIRRDSDNAILDMVSGQWLKLTATSQST